MFFKKPSTVSWLIVCLGNIGDKYVCKDGPVFRLDEMDELPDEY